MDTSSSSDLSSTPSIPPSPNHTLPPVHSPPFQSSDIYLHSPPLALFLQPACIQHKYIRTPNASHIYERPERVRAVMLGVASGVARLEKEDEDEKIVHGLGRKDFREQSPGLENLLSGLSIKPVETIDPVQPSKYIYLPPVPTLPPVENRGQLLVNHPAVRYSHSSGWEMPFPSLSGVKAKRERVRGGDIGEGMISGPLGPFSLGTTTTTSQGLISNTPVKSTTTAAPRKTPSKPFVPIQPQIPTSQYLRDLTSWSLNAPGRIKATGCEIPDDRGLNVGDLYLGPGSVDAIEGCIQTIAAAVDLICSDTDANKGLKNAFCVIRPPGHHCGEDSPSGFCYINNVVVGAMHAYLMHDYDRAIVFDFDLHHGNGTQSIIMGLNESSQAEELLRQGGKPLGPMSEEEEEKGRRRRCWKGFYGSVHDIWSYPCEDGDIDLVKDASVSLAGHGQYIENIHLQPYDSEDDFYDRLYPRYQQLLKAAEQYVKETDADPRRTVVFISAGFDACDYEHQTMQRHDRRVPPSFFSHITRDIKAFADKWASGKVISVLEGGYSDRALATGAMSHIHGFARASGGQVPTSWWDVDNVAKLERATKRKRTGRLASLTPECAAEGHLLRTHALLNLFDCHGTSHSASPPANSYADLIAEGPRRTLRERRKPTAVDATPPTSRTLGGKPKAKSATSTPVHAAQPPKAPATEGRPTGAIPSVPAIPDRMFADVLEASMQKMSLDMGDEHPTPKTPNPSTPAHAHALDHAVDSAPVYPSAAPRLQDLLNPQSPSPAPHVGGVERNMRESSEASGASSLECASAQIPYSLTSVTEGRSQPVLEQNERKVFLKFSLPKAEEEDLS